MLKEVVVVEDVFEGKVRIKFERKLSCSCCRLQAVCGQGKGSLDIDNDNFSLKKGDQIEVAIDEKRSLLATILIFLVPAAIFVVSLVIFKDKGEITSFFLALGVVCVYYVFLKLALKVEGKKFNLRIIRKL